MPAVNVSTTTTRRNVTGSIGGTLNNNDAMVRPNNAAAASPTAVPTAMTGAALPTTRRNTWRLVAPSAMRTPNSRVRCWTEYASTPNTPTIASTSASRANVPISTVQASVNNGRRVYDLEFRSNGNFNAILINDPTPQHWTWWYGLSAAQGSWTYQQYGHRIYDLQSYFVLGQRRFLWLFARQYQRQRPAL